MKVEFDFLAQHFECKLNLQKVNRHQTQIYQLQISTSPICIVAHGKVHRLKNGLFVVWFNSPYYFGMFGGPIAEKLSQELQKLAF